MATHKRKTTGSLGPLGEKGDGEAKEERPTNRPRTEVSLPPATPLSAAVVVERLKELDPSPFQSALWYALLDRAQGDAGSPARFFIDGEAIRNRITFPGPFKTNYPTAADRFIDTSEFDAKQPVLIDTVAWNTVSVFELPSRRFDPLDWYMSQNSAEQARARRFYYLLRQETWKFFHALPTTDGLKAALTRYRVMKLLDEQPKAVQFTSPTTTHLVPTIDGVVDDGSDPLRASPLQPPVDTPESGYTDSDDDKENAAEPWWQLVREPLVISRAEWAAGTLTRIDRIGFRADDWLFALPPEHQVQVLAEAKLVRAVFNAVEHMAPHSLEALLTKIYLMKVAQTSGRNVLVITDAAPTPTATATAGSAPPAPRGH